jgi:hypothetical protein
MIYVSPNAVTMEHSRPDKGMPIWKGVISDVDIGSIKACLDTVQQSS